MQLERVWPVATAVCQLFNQAALTFVRSYRSCHATSPHSADV